MIVAFDEIQRMVRDAAHGVCSTESGGQIRNPRDLWRQFTDLGWTGVVLPEKHGGSGGSLIDAGIICLEMGRGGLFFSYPDTVAFSRALAATGGHLTDAATELLAKIVAGNTAVALALQINGEDRLAPLQLSSSSEPALLTETAAEQTVIVRLFEGRSPRLMAVPLEGASARPARTIARGNDRIVDLETAHQSGDVLAEGDDAREIWNITIGTHRCLAGAQLIGAGRHFLTLASEYSGTRVQFGVAIGTFQAVQHALAETFAAAEGAELLIFKALSAIERGADPNGQVVTGAISFTRESMWTMLMKSYDILGGVGYMEEHPLSNYTRALLPVMAALGSAVALRRGRRVGNSQQGIFAMTGADPAMVKPLPTPSQLALPFWQALRRGEFQLQRCQTCGRYNHPPKLICPHCHGRKLEWEPAARTGIIYSFTIVHRPPAPAFKTDVPYAVGLVDIDDTDVRVLSSLVMPPHQVKVGMRVELFFDPVSDDMTLFRFRPLANADR